MNRYNYVYKCRYCGQLDIKVTIQQSEEDMQLCCRSIIGTRQCSLISHELPVLPPEKAMHSCHKMGEGAMCVTDFVGVNVE